MATVAPSSPRFSVIPDYASFPGVSGFNITITGNTTFSVSPGYARALCSDFALSFPSFAPNTPATLDVDIADTGINGCFPFSLASLSIAADTVFGVYVIGKSSGTTGGSLTNTANKLAVVVATGDNFLPEGYDSYRRIGLVCVDSATEYLLDYQQSGNGNLKTYILQDAVTVLNAGNATTKTTIDLTTGGGLVVPDKNITVLLNVSITPNAAGGYVTLEPSSLTATPAPVQIFGSVAAQPNTSYVQMTATPNASTGNANISYYVDAGGSASTIKLVGFVDDLGNELF